MRICVILASLYAGFAVVEIVMLGHISWRFVPDTISDWVASVFK
jgi:hypothetical protein